MSQFDSGPERVEFSPYPAPLSIDNILRNKTESLVWWYMPEVAAQEVGENWGRRIAISL